MAKILRRTERKNHKKESIIALTALLEELYSDEIYPVC